MKESYERGLAAEDIAARILEKKGYEMLERRFQCRQGEIDLIARDKGTLVFVEVKYRRSLAYGMPAEAVTPGKIRRLRAAARCYLSLHGLRDPRCRFDVLALWQDGKILKYHHEENAFEG